MGRVARITLWLTLFAGVAPPAWADARSTNVTRTLAEADRDVAHGAVAVAERRLRPLLGRRDADPRVVLRYLSLLLPLDGEAPSAARALAPVERRAGEVLLRLAKVELAPDADEDSRRAALHVAWAAALVGRFDESLAAVRTAGRQQDPTTLACLRHVATLAALREQLDVAHEALTLAHQYVPQDLVTMAELGRVLLARGRTYDAVSLLAERFAVEPGSLGARRDLAYALGASGRAGEGLTLLRHAGASCDVADGCALEAARLALEAGRPADAAQLAAQQLARAPDDVEALYVRADAEAEAGRFGEARATWQRVLALRPESARAKQALAQLPP